MAALFTNGWKQRSHSPGALKRRGEGGVENDTLVLAEAIEEGVAVGGALRSVDDVHSVEGESVGER
jgi:hypothetical protein